MYHIFLKNSSPVCLHVFVYLKVAQQNIKICYSIAFLNGAAETAVHGQIAVMLVVQPVALGTETERYIYILSCHAVICSVLGMYFTIHH